MLTGCVLDNKVFIEGEGQTESKTARVALTYVEGCFNVLDPDLTYRAL